MLAMMGAPGSTAFIYSSGYWTNDALVNPTYFTPDAKKDMKNPCFLYCPVQKTYVKMVLDVNGRMMETTQNIKRNNCKVLFSTTTHMNNLDITNVITVYNLDALLGGLWQRGNPISGFNLTTGGGCRYGIVSNQRSENGTSNANTHDSAVGIGINSRSAGAYAGYGDNGSYSTLRSGQFWLYIK